MTRVGFLAAVLFVLVQGGFGLWVALGARPAAGQPSVDFATYYLAAVAVSRDVDPYMLDDAGWNALASDTGVAAFAPPYRYPPLLAGILSHLLWLPYRALLTSWTFIGVGALFAAGVASSRAFFGRSIEPVVFFGLTGFVPAANALYNGQADVIVMAAVALLLALPPVRGGAALGASIVLKPLAGPVAAVLLWRRDRPRAVGMLVGAAIAAVTALVLAGPASWLAYAGSALRLSTLAPDVLELHSNNVSLFGAFGRTLVSQPSLARALALTAATLIISIAILIARRIAIQQAISLVVVVTLLAAPVVWYHDATLAFIPLAALWPAATTRVRAALAASYALLAAHGVVWRQVEEAFPQITLATTALVMLLLVAAFSALGAAPTPYATSPRTVGGLPRTDARTPPRA